MNLECTVCTRSSWFAIDHLKYDIDCPKCSSTYKFDSNKPQDKAKWAYKAVGPFSLPNYADGAYTVLFTIAFLHSSHDAKSTSMMSFTATKGTKALEADLGLLYQEQKWQPNPQRLIFAECKSFNRFKERDVSRLADLAVEFPDCVLIFASLNDALNDEETKIISELVLSQNLLKEKGLPHSPVIILTGLELFSPGTNGYLEAWKQKGGKHKTFADNRLSMESKLLQLAEQTNQLYLNMSSYFEWAQERAKKRKKA